MAWIFVVTGILFIGMIVSDDSGEPFGWALFIGFIVAIISFFISGIHVGQFEEDRKIPLKPQDGRYAVLENSDTIIFFTANGWESHPLYDVEIAEGSASLVLERTKPNIWDYVSEDRYVLTVPSDGIAIGSLG